jgi:hypothetical protein
VSEPKRYYANWSLDDDDMVVTHMAEDPKGGYIKLEDYARLKAEVERVGAENSHLNKGIYSLSLNVGQLKDEVERLTKAGDLICRMAGNNQVINRHWKTAKGVQS